MNIDPNTTKYMVKAKINADGIVEKPDVVGAIFGQTEGLLGDELDLRDLQKSGRIGRIEVEVTSKGGKSEGIIYMSSSLDQVETVILASALETVDRVGPCKASIHVLGIEDVRVTKREKVVERAKELLNELIRQSKGSSFDLTDSVRQSVQVEEITTYGKDRCPAGPNVKDSEAIIIVEGRSDVLNLLKAGIKNAIAVEGTNIPTPRRSRSSPARGSPRPSSTVTGEGSSSSGSSSRSPRSTSSPARPAPTRWRSSPPSRSSNASGTRSPATSTDQYMEMNGLVTEQRSLEEIEEEEDREEKHERRERRKERDEEHRERRKEREERREREPKKERFNSEAIDKYRKKPVEAPAEEPEEKQAEPADVIEMPAAERSLAVKGETHLMVREEPVETPAEETEAPAEESEEKPKKSKEEKPKRETKTRSLRGKRSSDKVLTPEQQEFRDMLLDLSTTHNAKVLGEGNSLIREVAVKSLVNSLKEDSENVVAIVFDGVISQRILDVSADKGITTIVGTRKGNITKMPADITIWTKEDLY